MDHRSWALLAEQSPAIWLHMLGVSVAIVTTIAILLLRKGTGPHRLLGRVWCAAMLIAAVSSFWIQEITPGRWSLIHLLSIWTIFAVFAGIWAIRKGRLRMHRGMMLGTAAGGLLIAGAFTFVPGRLMYALLTGG